MVKYMLQDRRFVVITHTKIHEMGFLNWGDIIFVVQNTLESQEQHVLNWHHGKFCQKCVLLVQKNSIWWLKTSIWCAFLYSRTEFTYFDLTGFLWIRNWKMNKVNQKVAKQIHQFHLNVCSKITNNGWTLLISKECWKIIAKKSWKSLLSDFMLTVDEFVFHSVLVKKKTLVKLVMKQNLHNLRQSPNSDQDIMLFKLQHVRWHQVMLACIKVQEEKEFWF